MKFFPQTPAYIINYWSGTAGAFLHFLIGLNLRIYNIEELISGLTGNAALHKHYYRQIYSTCRCKPIDDSLDRNLVTNPYLNNSFLIYEPCDPDKPIIFADHFFPDQDLLFSVYPKARHLIIQYDFLVAEIMQANMFYKVFVDGYTESTYGTNDFPQRMWPEVSAKFFNNAVSPLDVTTSQIKQFLRKSQIPIENNTPFIKGSLDINNKYKDCVYTLYYGDLLFDKNVMFKFIEDVTEIPLTEDTKEFYSYYIKQQIKILNICDLSMVKEIYKSKESDLSELLKDSDRKRGML